MRDSVEMMIAMQEENQRMAGKIQELETDNNARMSKEMGLLARIKELQRQMAGMTPAELAKFKTDIAAKEAQIKELQTYLSKVKEERDAQTRLVENERQARGALEQENNSMRGVIEKGRAAQFGPVLSYGIRTVKGAQEETFKSKQVEKLKITFDIVENPLVEQPIEQEVKLRILGPEGEVLSKNTTQLMDKSEVYSIKETIVFDGGHQKIKLYFSQATFKKGKYTVELWSDNVIRQKNTFVLE
jgi:TolA-binding protein